MTEVPSGRETGKAFAVVIISAGRLIIKIKPVQPP